MTIARHYARKGRHLLVEEKELKEVRQFASDAHDAVNQQYDAFGYVFHLDAAFQFAKKHRFLLTDELWFLVGRAVFCHDLLEDTRVSYTELRDYIGTDAAEIVYAVTNEKGRTRKEKANDKYYAGIRETPGAIFVKLCDRLANVHYSRQLVPFGQDLSVSSKLKMYQKEFPNFETQLRVYARLEPMWMELRDLLFRPLT